MVDLSLKTIAKDRLRIDCPFSVKKDVFNIPVGVVQYPSLSLRERLLWLNRKIAFVLSGGASKGDFEVGVVKFLAKKGTRPDIICGTSVGAINGSKLAEGEGAIDGLEQIWLGLKYPSDMYVTEQWLNEIDPGIRQGILSVFSGSSAPDFGLSLLEWQDFLIPLYSQIKLYVLDNKITQLLDKLSGAKSIFNLDPIENKLRDTNLFNPAKIIDSKIKLRLTMVNMNTGKIQYVDETGLMSDTNGAVTVDLTKAIIASAGIPVIFRPTILNGEPYFDGGLRAIVPLKAAFSAGADFAYVIMASGPGLQYGLYNNKGILDILSRTIDILADEVKDTDTYLALAPNQGMLVIEPSYEVHSGMDIDPGLISISIDYGYMRGADIVEGIPQGQAKLADLLESSDKITALRKEIWLSEYYANGREFEWAPVSRPGSETFMPADPEGLDFVRQKKRELCAIVGQRIAMGGIVPDNIEDWWGKWERHKWSYFMPTPWDQFDSRAGSRPKQDPPSLP